jgi:uncharacterized RDD family membrane protein YckC
VPPGGWQQPVAPQPSQAPAYSGALASWGSRLGAHLLDGLLLLGVLIVAGGLIAIMFAISDIAGIVAAVVLGLAALVVLLGYAPLLMAREGPRNGQTLGKQVLNIKVVRTDGQKIGGGFAALREIVLKNIAVTIASSIIPVIPWFLNYFWPLWDDENRALHDMALDTRVVMTS